MIDEKYSGWIYIVQSKGINNIKDQVSPDRNGIIYISTRQFQGIDNINITFQDKHNPQSTDKIYIGKGEYYFDNPDKILSYIEIYYPIDDYFNAGKMIIDSSGNLSNRLEVLMKTQKVDTSIIF